MPKTVANAVTVIVPSALRHYCGGADRLGLSAASVRAALAQLERTRPELHGCLCDETGSVRRHINIFVNSDHIRDLSGLNTALRSGDVLTILPAVSGG